MKKILLTVWTLGTSLTGIFAQQESLILDINPGAMSSNTQILGKEGNLLILSSDDGTHGFEIWTTDGTTSGTQLYWDVVSGSESSYPTYRGILNGAYIFTANATSFDQYWILKSDISGSNSSILAIFSSTGMISSPDNFATLGTKMLFSAETSGDGKELWITDGTMGGTQMLKDIVPGVGSSGPNELIYFQGYVYFAATDGSGDRELWRSDGTAMGTQRFADIHPSGSSSPMFFYVVGNTMYFGADDGVHGRELWKTDGTPGGTVLVKDLDPGAGGWGAAYGYDFNGKYVFITATAAEGNELWISDGTSSGTFMLKDIEPGPQGGMQYVNGYASTNNKLLFFATTTAEGTEPWITDGTTSGTYRLKDIQQGIYGSGGTNTPVSHNGKFYFIAYNDVIGREIYESDGTTLGTNAITDIDVSALGYGPDPWGKLALLNGNLIFSASEPTHGSELWKLQLGTNFLPEKIGVQNTLDIFPNPSKGMININLRDDHDEFSVLEIIDLTGKTLLTKDHCIEDLDISQIPNGTYFIRAIFRNGDQLTNKLIIAR